MIVASMAGGNLTTSPVAFAAVTLQGSCRELRTVTVWTFAVFRFTVPNATGYGESRNVGPAPVPLLPGNEFKRGRLVAAIAGADVRAAG
jgi:hypothetical protein